MKRELIARIAGQSTSGVSHDVLIERDVDGMIMVTVMGADGKKRHASSKIYNDTFAWAIEELAQKVQR
jgi:hypothetical protein